MNHGLHNSNISMLSLFFLCLQLCRLCKRISFVPSKYTLKSSRQRGMMSKTYSQVFQKKNTNKYLARVKKMIEQWGEM